VRRTLCVAVLRPRHGSDRRFPGGINLYPFCDWLRHCDPWSAFRRTGAVKEHLAAALIAQRALRGVARRAVGIAANPRAAMAPRGGMAADRQVAAALLDPCCLPGSDSAAFATSPRNRGPAKTRDRASPAAALDLGEGLGQRFEAAVAKSKDRQIPGALAVGSHGRRQCRCRRATLRSAAEPRYSVATAVRRRGRAC
jgi:hypothetical protein